MSKMIHNLCQSKITYVFRWQIKRNSFIVIVYIDAFATQYFPNKPNILIFGIKNTNLDLPLYNLLIKKKIISLHSVKHNTKSNIITRILKKNKAPDISSVTPPKNQYICGTDDVSVAKIYRTKFNKHFYLQKMFDSYQMQ
ncbi:hypothetical protein BpHYR1_036423 [Brachionus plicatilis]|uniref:Uncharacterized protein n=1 Tax=Brachionus plicatilis TaxID=10195 RepID=A0A3M7QDI8_BRAPC|nr:hypothetical protein BpHYR1_036423 [Brachionus plicatilis]